MELPNDQLRSLHQTLHGKAIVVAILRSKSAGFCVLMALICLVPCTAAQQLERLRRMHDSGSIGKQESSSGK